MVSADLSHVLLLVLVVGAAEALVGGVEPHLLHDMVDSGRFHIASFAVLLLIGCPLGCSSVIRVLQNGRLLLLSVGDLINTYTEHEPPNNTQIWVCEVSTISDSVH